MSKKHSTTIELRGGDAEIIVEYTAHKGQSSGLHGPAEPAWVEIDAVTYAGITITDSLPKWQIERLQEEIEEELTAQRDFDEGYAEYRRERNGDAGRELDARDIKYWEAREHD